MTNKLLAYIAAALMVGSSTEAAPRFSRGTSIDGVIAYQDASDKTQFHYLPGRVDLALGSTLNDFKATYWGIGPAMMAQTSTGEIVSVVGAIVSGRATIDISAKQRKEIEAEIKKTFGVSAPKLLPLQLQNVQVKPVVAGLTLGLEKGDIVFPPTVQFGSTFAYSLGTGDSRFAQIAASTGTGTGITPNPHFGVNVVGDVEFQGDPWEADIQCDLSQVWSEVRRSGGASVGWGWWKVSGSWSDLEKSLEKSGACSFSMVEGSLNNEQYGRQVFEMMKDIFTQINKQAVAGEGFFKFEPNPDLPAAPDGPISDGGWGVSVNLSYSSAHFKQSIMWKTKLSYSGRFKASVPASAVLAVDCTAPTRKYFADVGNVAEPCMTQAKVDTFNARLKAELAEKNKRVLRLLDRYLDGEITQEQYDRALGVLTRMSLVERSDSFDDSSARDSTLHLPRFLYTGPSATAEDAWLIKLLNEDEPTARQ